MNNFIIDGSNLAYRSHNANLELKTGSDLPSGMFFGFLRTIIALKKKYRGFGFSVVWDNRAKAKFEIQPDYKAGRSALPPTAWSQVKDIRDSLTFLGVEQYDKADQEADDVIATVATNFKDQGGKVYIYTNDKDMLQLVEDGKIIVFKPKVGTTPEKFYDEESVQKQYGVPAKKLAFFRSFDGDASDNIKGISRVPRKVIASMVNKYADVDELYSNLPKHKLTDFQKQSFLEAQQRIKNNIKIVKLNTNLQDVRLYPAASSKGCLTTYLDKYEIKSIKPDEVIDLFSSTLDIRYTDPVETVQLETYSLF
jgi:DNA polymerase-1